MKTTLGTKAFQVPGNQTTVPKKRRAFQETGARKGFRSSVRVRCGHILIALLFVGLLEGPARAEVEEARVMEVARELACLCGTCPNRPMDECRCGHAGQQRERIAKSLEAGQTKDQVIAGFVSEFGIRIFVTPPKEGFNLMAWFMPFFGIAVGGYAVRSVLKGWSRTDTKRKSPALSDEDRAKLDAVLKDRE